MASMQIGAIARKGGVTVDAVRFYERRGLLPRAARSAGGFRQYQEQDVETLGFIRRAQALGFTLAEIRDLLQLRVSRLQPCAPVCRRLERKISQVRKKLESLRELELELQAALRACSRSLGKRPNHCPLLTRPARRNPRSSK